jgi:LysM repeat protein
MGSPYEVIDLVNQLRAANGLAAYRIDPALMAAAQGQSEYQASVHSITHYGPGGSVVKSRVLAAGYGGGSGVSAAENIYGGANASSQQAINWWKGDAAHLDTMLASRFTDVGAGVATDGSLVYYTLNVGAIVGGVASTSAPGGSPNPTAAPGTETTNLPVLMATPMPDGSIIHTVKNGQTLWTIAAIYNVPLAELLTLNKFNEFTTIFPGQEVLVKDVDPTPTIVITPTNTRRPPATPTRFSRPSATPLAQALPSPTVEETPSPETSTSGGVNTILWIIGGLVIGGVILMVVGQVLNSRSPKP